MNETEQYKRLADDIFATQGDEVHGEQIEAQMILATEAQLSEEESRRRYPAMWHHFRFDSDAESEYRMMMALAQMEAAGGLVQPTQVPSPPRERGMALGDQIRSTVRSIFAGFAPAASSALTRGESMSIEPVEVAFEEEEIFIELDVDQAESTPDLRDLFCRVSVEADNLTDQLEAAPIRLQFNEDGPILQEEALDELGDATFTNIEPGRYTVHLQIGDSNYTIAQVIVP